MDTKTIESLLSASTVNIDVSVNVLLINMVVGLIISLLIKWHYVRFGQTFSNRSQLALVFPFIVLSIVLIITIVKSSLALSLGLVGALSIVRFRTPIKEPEELSYLFLAIATGLGLGANMTMITIAGSIFILIIGAAVKLFFTRKNKNVENGMFFNLSMELNGDKSVNYYFELINEIIIKYNKSFSLKRFDSSKTNLEVIYFINISNAEELTMIISDIEQNLPRAHVSFIDHRDFLVP
jgi:uncharacterized membrane protein YhiD involved in acid resistance